MKEKIEYILLMSFFPLLICFVIYAGIMSNIDYQKNYCKCDSPITVVKHINYIPGGFLGIGARSENVYICKKCGKHL